MLFKCKGCGITLWRPNCKEYRKLWTISYCEKLGKDQRIYRIKKKRGK